MYQTEKHPIHQSLFLLVIFQLFTTAGLAEDNSTNIPENSSARYYGSGWDCDNGYRKNDDKCLKVVIPQNAYATNRSYGNGWKCNWGYIEKNNTCLALEVPANAYIITYGDRWDCNRGYLKSGNTCMKVIVPENAYFTETSFAAGWKCERGYQEKDQACEAIKLPPNSHLDYSGNGWECNPPYVRTQNNCELRSQ